MTIEIDSKWLLWGWTVVCLIYAVGVLFSSVHPTVRGIYSGIGVLGVSMGLFILNGEYGWVRMR